MLVKTFVANVETVLGLNVDISPKIKSVGFHVIPKRWVVERTFAWFGNSRRLDKDFEKTISSQEAMIKNLPKNKNFSADEFAKTHHVEFWNKILRN